MKKFLLALLLLTFANIAYASCESCASGDANCPASCKSASKTLNKKTTPAPTKTKPQADTTVKAAPASNIQAYDKMDTEAVPASLEEAVRTLDGVPELNTNLSPKELESRMEAAYELINSPDIIKFTNQLRDKKAEIISKLQKNHCIDPGFDVEVSNFIDKLTKKTYDQKALSTGLAQIFNENELSSIEQNIHNPPQDLQPRIGMVFIQFVMNEAPVLFSQTIKISQNQECLNKANFN